jgi:hypothetical protein
LNAGATAVGNSVINPLNAVDGDPATYAAVRVETFSVPWPILSLSDFR